MHYLFPSRLVRSFVFELFMRPPISWMSKNGLVPAVPSLFFCQHVRLISDFAVTPYPNLLLGDRLLFFVKPDGDLSIWERLSAWGISGRLFSGRLGYHLCFIELRTRSWTSGSVVCESPGDRWELFGAEMTLHLKWNTCANIANFWL